MYFFLIWEEKKKVFIQSHWRKNVVLQKTFRRKLCILTALLRAIIDILCIYSANLHPNREDVGFVSAHIEILQKSTGENASHRSRKK